MSECAITPVGTGFVEVPLGGPKVRTWTVSIDSETAAEGTANVPVGTNSGEREGSRARGAGSPDA